MNIPSELLYTKDHEWVRIEDEVATVGITDFAQRELGDIVFVEVETKGDSLEKGSVFGTVEAVKTVSDLFMPLSGEVLETNGNLEANPEFINTDPYEKGWIIKIKIKESGTDLLSAKEYGEEIGV